jgi:hypothetical protein
MLTLATLVLALAPAAAPAAECLLVEISTVGPSAHGATVLRYAAPHRLIRAIDRLPQWVEASDGVDDGSIVALAAATAINVIAPRASAQVEVRLSTTATDPAAVLTSLESALGQKVEIRRLAGSCTVLPAPN